MCHWAYFVERKVLRGTQQPDDVHWTIVSDYVSTIHAASKLAAEEFMRERDDIDVWPLKSWAWHTGDNGMARF